MTLNTSYTYKEIYSQYCLNPISPSTRENEVLNIGTKVKLKESFFGNNNNENVDAPYWIHLKDIELFVVDYTMDEDIPTYTLSVDSNSIGINYKSLFSIMLDVCKLDVKKDKTKIKHVCLVAIRTR